MGNKIMVVLGLILSFLLFYFCLNFKGENSSFESANDLSVVSTSSVNGEKASEGAEETAVKAPAKGEETEKEAKESLGVSKSEFTKEREPYFKYIENTDGSGFEVEALMSEGDENSPLLDYVENSPSENSKKDIKIEKGVKGAEWEGFALSVIKFFGENGVKNGKFVAENGKIVIEGVFSDENSFNEFKKLLSSQSGGFVVEDKTSLETPKVAAVSKENEALKKEPEAKGGNVSGEEESGKIKEVEEKIAKMLRMEPIRFKLNSSKITPDSQKTLQKAVKLLDSLGDDVSVEIAGYTDARGDEKYNLSLSQRRAEAVKRYLEKNMKTKKNMVAKGYGESNFISEDPNDKSNRRVEIHLMREGE